MTISIAGCFRMRYSAPQLVYDRVPVDRNADVIFSKVNPPITVRMIHAFPSVMLLSSPEDGKLLRLVPILLR